MNLPLVSIQIPTYNQENFLSRAIESCLQQTYPNLEINVADDGSSDNTAQLVADYCSDGRLHYYRNQPNLGRVPNYHKAITEYASGSWAINLDGDDYFTNPMFIENAMKMILQVGEPDVLFYMAASNYGTVEQVKLSSPNIQQQSEVVTGEAFFNNYHKLNHFTHLGLLCNRKKLMQLNEYYEKNISSADMFTFLNFCIKNKSNMVLLSKEVAGMWLWDGKNYSQNLGFAEVFKNYKNLASLTFVAFKFLGIVSGIKWLVLLSYHTWGAFVKKKLIKKN